MPRTRCPAARTSWLRNRTQKQAPETSMTAAPSVKTMIEQWERRRRRADDSAGARYNHSDGAEVPETELSISRATNRAVPRRRENQGFKATYIISSTGVEGQPVSTRPSR